RADRGHLGADEGIAGCETAIGHRTLEASAQGGVLTVGDDVLVGELLEGHVLTRRCITQADAGRAAISRCVATSRPAAPEPSRAPGTGRRRSPSAAAWPSGGRRGSPPA